MSGSTENIDDELVVQNEIKTDEKKENQKKPNKLPVEGPGSLELNLFKGPKTWKRSLTQFFRNQIRSTKSNDGDGPSGSSDPFPESDISPEQKWQSLGKMFRRPQAESWSKDGEERPPKKSVALKKVLSSYFGKNPKTLPAVADEN